MATNHLSDVTLDANATVDAQEIARFTSLAEQWWDPNGKFRPVHKFNPVRLAAIENWIAGNFGRHLAGSNYFAGLRILDVGCGAGLICEPLVRRGASLVGIDATPRNIEIARWHAAESSLDIDYRCLLTSRLVEDHETFDVVLNLEVVEHVPDPARLIEECATLVKPGGILVVATLDRTLRSFLLAIVGAEYILGWLPRGTHQWRRFLRPGEIRRYIEPTGLETVDLTGVSFGPMTNRWRLSADTAVNYMLLARRPR